MHLGRFNIRQFYLDSNAELDMDQIEILYTDSKGESHTATYDRDTSKITIVLEDAVSLDLAGISDCEELKHLVISSCDILTEIDLSQIGSLRNIEIVEISFNNFLRELDLTHLANCDKFQTLEIVYCDCLETLILPPSPTLNRIRFEENNDMQDLDLSPLSQCNNLQIIAIRRSKNLRLSNLSALSSCHQLEKLLIEELGPDRWDLTPLCTVENLQYLNITINHDTQELAPLRDCPRLEKLHLYECRITEFDMSVFTDFKHLKLLHIEGSENVEHFDLRPLSQCPSLETVFVLSNKRLQEIILPSSPVLREIAVSGNAILPSIDVTPLSTCPELEYFWMVENDAIETLDLSSFSRCPKFEELGISKHPNLQEVILPVCPQLTRFEINSCGELLELDLSPFSQSVHLKEIAISWCTKLQQLDLVPLADCQELEKLYIAYNGDLRRVDFTPILHAQFDSFHCDLVKHTLLSRETIETSFPYWMKHLDAFDTIGPFYSENILNWLVPLIREHESDSWKISFLAQNLVALTGLQHLGLLDIPLETLEDLLVLSLDERQIRIIELFIDQFRSGGTSILAEIERFTSEELAYEVEDILHRRREEIMNVTVARVKDKMQIDIRALYLTAWGFKIASSIKAHTFCYQLNFEKIQEAIEDLGGSLIFVDESKITFPDNISPNLREYILRLSKPPQHQKQFGDGNSFIDSISTR